jgi:hypothetical protein
MLRKHRHRGENARFFSFSLRRIIHSNRYDLRKETWTIHTSNLFGVNWNSFIAFFIQHSLSAFFEIAQLEKNEGDFVCFKVLKK